MEDITISEKEKGRLWLEKIRELGEKDRKKQNFKGILSFIRKRGDGNSI